MQEFLQKMTKSKRFGRDGVPLPTPPGPRKPADTDTRSRPETRYGAAPSNSPQMASPADHALTSDLEEDEINPLTARRLCIQSQSFESYVNTMQHQEPSGFAEQFADLAKVGISQSTRAGQDPMNASKNSFKNILPYDESRVKLKVGDGVSSDYINASYVDGFDSSRGYIACQLPSLSGVSDWWRMIWDQNITKVILMEPPTGARRRKKHSLWPEEINELCEYEKLKLQWTQETVSDYCTSRKMFIQMEKHRRPVMIYELRAPSFDKSETTVRALLEFRKFVRKEIRKNTETTTLLVCCRLGAGKTGVFICLDRVLQSIHRSDVVEIYRTLHRMRKQRMMLVKTVDEYELVHLCIVRHILRTAN